MAIASFDPMCASVRRLFLGRFRHRCQRGGERRREAPGSGRNGNDFEARHRAAPPLPIGLLGAASFAALAATPAYGRRASRPPARRRGRRRSDRCRRETSTNVVVTGFRQSLTAALGAKRKDTGIVDVIVAEDIADFPDQNLAESLQRIPGVAIDRDAGEGRQITVRGLGGDFTRVRLNQLEALATTGGTDSSGGANRSRAFDFNVFASELFNRLTVRKSASAEVDEGSLGATVDLQTARPFDYSRLRHVGERPDGL